MTLYDRLNLIGVTLPMSLRSELAATAKILRTWGGTKFAPNGRDVLEAYDDELGALADQLDTLAGPIVVQR